MNSTIYNDSNLHWENPMQTDGFEFLEFATLDSEDLNKKFIAMGFTAVAKHKQADITLYQQGNIRFLVNAEPHGKAHEFAKVHGSSVSAMGFRVKDAEFAYKRALELGAHAYHPLKNSHELELPAIYGVGGSLIFFVEQDNNSNPHNYMSQFTVFAEAPPLSAHGLTYIDHVTHNLHRGEMDKWAEFYSRLFNFRQIRYFDIEGKLTGLTSRAMTAPCGKIRIPLNQSSDDKSQIEEFLKDFNGEGIQHIALGTNDIYNCVAQLRNAGLEFLDTPDTYYEKLEKRLPGHGERLPLLQKYRILIDGNIEGGPKLLLQIFTKNLLGPVFFEIIQRKGDEGFGEGNFKALFESIEEDQIRRGVLKETEN